MLSRVELLYYCDLIESHLFLFIYKIELKDDSREYVQNSLVSCETVVLIVIVFCYFSLFFFFAQNVNNKLMQTRPLDENIKTYSNTCVNRNQR